MENEVMNVAKQGTTEILKNTHINMSLSEWPATAVLITACISCVAIYGIKAYIDLSMKEAS